VIAVEVVAGQRVGPPRSPSRRRTPRTSGRASSLAGGFDRWEAAFREGLDAMRTKGLLRADADTHRRLDHSLA
jgi:hypothetical protein